MSPDRARIDRIYEAGAARQALLDKLKQARAVLDRLDVERTSTMRSIGQLLRQAQDLEDAYPDVAALPISHVAQDLDLPQATLESLRDQADPADLRDSRLRDLSARQIAARCCGDYDTGSDAARELHKRIPHLGGWAQAIDFEVRRNLAESEAEHGSILGSSAFDQWINRAESPTLAALRRRYEQMVNDIANGQTWV